MARSRSSRARWIGAIPLLLTACGDDGGGNPGQADATYVDAFRADAPPPGEPHFDTGARRGRIEVIEVRGTTGQPGRAELQAVLAAEPTSAQIVFYGRIGVMHWQAEVARVGECRLLEPTPAFCTVCDGLCVAPEVCEPFPTYARAGDLTFTGLSAGPFTLTQLIIGDPYWYASQGELGPDAFTPDATITARAPGATLPALEVSSGAVPDLVDQVPEILELVDGADTRVGWTPATGAARVRLRLNANNRGHGQPYQAVIECDSPDDGEIVIDRALVERFPVTLEVGACAGSDCPASTLTRYRSASIDVAGAAVDLVIGSRRDFWIRRP